MSCLVMLGVKVVLLRVLKIFCCC